MRTAIVGWLLFITVGSMCGLTEGDDNIEYRFDDVKLRTNPKEEAEPFSINVRNYVWNIPAIEGPTERGPETTLAVPPNSFGVKENPKYSAFNWIGAEKIKVCVVVGFSTSVVNDLFPRTREVFQRLENEVSEQDADLLAGGADFEVVFCSNGVGLTR